MFTTIRERLEDREDGFTLIELLVVVIIIGILAAVAIPVFLNQREKAWEAAVQADLKNAATAQETFFTDNNAYSEDVAALAADAVGFNPSDDVTFANDATFVTDYSGASTTGYCMEASHDANATAVWHLSSDVGSPAEGACP